MATKTRKSAHINNRSFATTTAIVLAGLSAYTIWKDLHVYVTHYSLETDKVTEKLRIVQVSDFHNDRLLGSKMLDKVRSESPNIIVITGDFIDRHRTDAAYALDVAEELAGIAPVYYVPGNHESAVSSYAELKDGLISRGVTIVGSDPVAAGAFLGLPCADIDLYGINDPYFVSENSRRSRAIIKDTLSDIAPDSGRFSILLSHRPESFEDYVSSGFDLVFTGHAHGGQLRLPGIGGIFAPGQGLLPKYDAGEFRSGDTTMIVSRGIGNSLLPPRIGDPPEVVVLDIEPLK